MASVRWRIHGPEAMTALGRAFGQACRGGEVFGLHGPLGAGKTQWVKGLGAGLGVTGVINSPAFTLVKPHEGRLRLHHVDLYRLAGPEQSEELALEDLLAPDTVMAIEWAERHPGFTCESISLTIELVDMEENVRCVACQCDADERIVDSVREFAATAEGITEP